MNRFFVAAFIGLGIYFGGFLATLMVITSGSALLEQIFLVATFIFFLPAAPLGLLFPHAPGVLVFIVAYAAWYGLFELRRYIYRKLEARRLTSA